MKDKRKFMAAVLLMSAVMLSGSVELYPSGVALVNASNDPVGADSSSVFLASEDCPVVVDKEVLTFDINSTDDYHYYNKNLYSGKVTAEYTFRNPSDRAIEVRYMFPFREIDLSEFNDLPGKDAITVKKNGVDVDVKVRYSDQQFGYHYDRAISCRQWLLDDYRLNKKFKTDTTVYEYEITVRNGSVNKNPSFVCFFYKNGLNVPVISDKADEKYKDGGIELTKRIDEDKKMSLVFIGESGISENDFELLDENKKHMDGKVNIEQKSVCTLKDYLLGFRPDWFDANDIDWYNVAYQRTDEVWVTFKSEFEHWKLFCWYDYTLTFEPGETLVNTVVAPLYPEVESAWYEPMAYEYTHLLQPLTTWADFKDLTIRINTDMFLLDGNSVKRFMYTGDNIDYNGETKSLGFEKGDGFYETHLDELPDGELFFRLCSVENPVMYAPPLGCGKRRIN